MKKKRILIICLLITTVCLSVFSQIDSIEKHINIEEYGNQIALKYNQLNGYLQCISNKDKHLNSLQQIDADENKNDYIKETLKLFIGKGEPFLDSAGVKHPAAIASLFTITKDSKVRIRHMKLETLLHKLKYLRYKSVQVDFVEVYFPIKILCVDGDNSLITMERKCTRQDLTIVTVHHKQFQ